MNTIEHIVQHPKQRTHDTPLLFLHGAWQGAWCWERFLDDFASRGYEVHAISLPGHGGSAITKNHINKYRLKDYLQCLATEVDKIEPTPIVTGHSLGGAVLQKYLETHHLPGAVLLATTPSGGAAKSLVRMFLRYPRVVTKMLLTWNAYVMVDSPTRVKAMIFSKDNPSDVNEVHRRLGDESMGIMLPLLFPWTLKSKKVRSPVLVLAGEKDLLFTAAEQRRTADALKATFKVFPGQAHQMMMEPAWREVAEAIDAWIGKTVALS
jgi:pimeloyl-ACP methyl ester carboxylesterase